MRAFSRTVLRLVVFAALLLLPCAYGNIAAYIAMLAVLLSVAVAFDADGFAYAWSQAGIRMLMAAFALISIAFIAGPADYASIVDFTPLLLAVPAAALFYRSGRANGALIFSSFCLAGSAVAAVVGAHDVLVRGAARASGLENSPIHYADEAIVLGFMALAGLLAPGRNKWRLLYLLGPPLGTVAMIFAGTRGAMLVAVALLALAGSFLFLSTRMTTRTKIVVALGAPALIGVSLWIGQLFGFTRSLDVLPPILDTLAGRTPEDTSSSYRLEFYQAGIRAWGDAPIFGHGWHNQITSSLPYMNEAAQQGFLVEKWGYLHNEPLGFLVSGGVFGLAAYLLVMLSPFALLRTSPRDDQWTARLYLVLAIVIGMFVSGMTDVLFMAELPKTFFCIVPVCLVLFCRDAPPPLRQTA
jgi:O-antigen ligase